MDKNNETGFKVTCCNCNREIIITDKYVHNEDIKVYSAGEGVIILCNCGNQINN